MTIPKCAICKQSSPSVFILNYIDKGQVKICPTCNKKRVNKENLEIEEPEFNRDLFNKKYFDKEIKK